MQIDETRHHDSAGEVTYVGAGVGAQIRPDLRHPPLREGHVGPRIEPLRRIDHASAAKDEIERRGHDHHRRRSVSGCGAQQFEDGAGQDFGRLRRKIVSHARNVPALHEVEEFTPMLVRHLGHNAIRFAM
jgi:hypothetical protein